jgi:uncharacterized membrane protein
MDSNNLPPSDSQSPPPKPPSPPPPAPEPPPIPPPSGSSQEPAYGAWVSEAWNLVLAEPVLLIIGWLVLAVIITISGVVAVGPLLLTGPLMVGYYLVIQKRLNGEPASFEDLFAGFQDFVRTMIAGLLFCAFWVAGTIINVIAGFILQFVPCLGWVVSVVLAIVVVLLVFAATFFLLPMVALSRIEPVDACKRSLEIASEEIKPVILLTLLIIGLQCAGTLACGLGLLITGPMAMVIQVLAYKRYCLARVGGTA